MTTKTLTALRASIAHHEKNLRARVADDVRLGPSSCALCRIFQDARRAGDECVGCPVMNRTGKPLCEATPYQALHDFHWAWCKTDADAAKKKFLAAERAEIKFLKSLLPKGKK